MNETVYTGKKVKRSYIHMERVDSENVPGIIDGDDPEELLAMLCDGIAEVLNEHPKLWRAARKLMRQTLRDFCPDLVGYWLDGIVGRMLACGLIFAAMCGLAAWVA